MENNELMHHGIRGMRWGVRRTPEQLGRVSGSSKKKTIGRDKVEKTKKSTKSSDVTKKTFKEMTDAELREKIARLELEKRYKDLSKSDPKPNSKGKAFIMDVLEKSGKNIATQLTTYAMGKAVNATFKDIFNDPAVVNPKKGQKDK